ncbi:MAG TPA: zinc ABC transporter substrate-binding protein [Solirubrobacteraceae bacterium]|jgi:zinc/manganese transport system substrate-binding protein
MTTRRALLVVAPLVLAAALAGCGGGAPSGGRLQVVAAENFWGSIADQLAGSKATVTSIIVNPNTDPHSYDASPSDARTFAGAKLAIVNGIGYDGWASKLVAASPLAGRITLDAGNLLGLIAGDNPHQWYSPSSVTRVADAITADLIHLDPRDRAYFRARARDFRSRALARYHRLIAQIRTRYHGVAVGYSESIFAPLGEALGLRLMTPYSFAKAIAEGTDVTAADTRTVDRQAQQRLIKVWVFNRQNVTPEVQRVNQLARAAGIPIATVTETLAPASDSFEQWQVAQLEELERALSRGVGR